jgi:hypothetical protein
MAMLSLVSVLLILQQTTCILEIMKGKHFLQFPSHIFPQLLEAEVTVSCEDRLPVSALQHFGQLSGGPAINEPLPSPFSFPAYSPSFDDCNVSTVLGSGLIH